MHALNDDKTMLKQHLTLTILLFLIITSTYADCYKIKSLTLNSARVKARAETITQPGNYCLSQNVVTPRVYDYEGERYDIERKPVLGIESGDVNINMQSKMINGDLGGMMALSTREKDQNTLFHRIAIHDGTVKSRTNVGIYFAGEYISSGFNSTYEDFLGEGDKQDFWIKYANDAWMAQNKKLAEIRNNFPLTEHRIESVKIASARLAIGIKGGGNIIKNNIIKVGDSDTTSIYLFGPNQLIENNIIIFNGKTRSSRSSAAPIKIHAADGTIIRNNTIIIEGGGQDVPQAAISIFDSKNVVIENNKIFGTKSAYKIWDEENKGSSVIESGTTFPSFWKKPRPSF